MYHIKNDKRARQSSAMIFEALQALMGEKAYESITITELVERAGVGRATFYRAFDNVEDVLRMQCDRKMDELTTLLLRERGRKDSHRRGLRIFLQYWYDNADIISLLYQARCFESMIHSFHELFRKIFPHIHPAPVIPDKFSDYIFAMQSGAVLGLLMQWFVNGKEISPNEMARLMEHTMRGFEAQHSKTVLPG